MRGRLEREAERAERAFLAPRANREMDPLHVSAMFTTQRVCSRRRHDWYERSAATKQAEGEEEEERLFNLKTPLTGEINSLVRSAAPEVLGGGGGGKGGEGGRRGGGGGGDYSKS